MSGVSYEDNWMTLSEYSNKYGLSISTLRRRIKANQVEYKMINGKYFLNSQETNQQNVSSSVPQPETYPAPAVPAAKMPKAQFSSKEENTFQTAKVLLDELKKAYMQALHEKEQQIIQLKQQIADLKTLVMYLERENAKYNKEF